MTLINIQSFFPISSLFKFSINNKLNISSCILLSNFFLFLLLKLILLTILYSSKTSFTQVTNFAFHCLIKLLHPKLFVLKISQGITNSSFHKSRAIFAVINVQDFFAASIIKTQEEIVATNSFLIGKL